MTDNIIVQPWSEQGSQIRELSQPLSLQQSKLYYDALSLAGVSLEGVDLCNQDTAIGRALIIQKKLLNLFHVKAILRGPIFVTSVPDSQRYSAIKALHDYCHSRRILIMPSSDQTAHLYQQASFKKVMTGDSSVIINLSPSLDDIRADMEGNWRNSLSKAERSPLTFDVVENREAVTYFITKEKEQQRRAGYWRGLPNNFPALCYESDPASIIMIHATLKGQLVAGILSLVHGNCATYYIGWSDDIGRKHNAHNLLLWQTIIQLKEAGINYLDLDGVDTESAAGIARFKIGTGGNITNYPGSYMPPLFAKTF